MAILFDTSVWIRHFRLPEKELVESLENGTALIHETIIGELAVGRIPNPKSTINDLLRLPFAPVVSFLELLSLLQQQKLISKGLSWVDIHLIGSALAIEAELITYDIALAKAWESLN